MKLTPLNITLACVLVWAFSEMQTEGEAAFSMMWLIVLVVMLAGLDLLFRIMIKDLKKLWFLQIGFILLVGILVVILRVI